ncbi:MAG TPA: hypothetical protein VEA60_14175 [Allosphingosinicella sp.]|nr:hypothetical protein [Allosphingosinicella sp.]
MEISSVQHIVISAVSIIGVSLVIALIAGALIAFRPSARRRRRHKKRTRRPRIDLFAPRAGASPPETDA